MSSKQQTIMLSGSKKNLESRTIDMYISTCEFVKNLIGEMIHFGTPLSPYVFQVTNDLIRELSLLNLGLNKTVQTEFQQSSKDVVLTVEDSNAQINKKTILNNKFIEVTEKSNEGSENFNNSKCTGKNVSVQEEYKDNTVVIKFTSSKSVVSQSSTSDTPISYMDSNKNLEQQLKKQNYNIQEIASKTSELKNSVSKQYKTFTKNLELFQLNIGTFYCINCDLFFLSQPGWVDHCLTSDHKNTEAKISCSFVSCDTCKLYIFGEKSRLLEYSKYHSNTVHSDPVINVYSDTTLKMKKKPKKK